MASLSAAEVSKRCFAEEPLRFVAGCDERCGRALGPDADAGHQLEGGLRDEWFEDGVELGDLGLERQGPSGRRSQGELGE